MDTFVDGNLNSIDPLWYLLIGFGCVPRIIVLYFWLTISETL